MKLNPFLLALFSLGPLSTLAASPSPPSSPHGASTSPDQLHSTLTDMFAPNSTASTHTNNWAVLVCSSRYWFNYRHMANTLAMYRTIKRLGMPDSNIILMLADDVACNARNTFPATVFGNRDRRKDLYGQGVEVDYRGYEVTVESFLRLLTGRHAPHTPPSKRLLTDASSNVFLYMTGHGGDEFLKFQDNEEISAFDIADAIEQMHEKRRYNKLLYVVDTCQANTMYSKFYSPGIISTGSSEIGESSYSHHNDHDIGTAVIDSYTHYILEYFEQLGKTSKATLQDFFNTYDPARIHSHPGISTELSTTPPEEILVTDFLGAVAAIEPMSSQSVLDPLSSEGRAAASAFHESRVGQSRGWDVVTKRKGIASDLSSRKGSAAGRWDRLPSVSDTAAHGAHRFTPVSADTHSPFRGLATVLGPGEWAAKYGQGILAVLALSLVVMLSRDKSQWEDWRLWTSAGAGDEMQGADAPVPRVGGDVESEPMSRGKSKVE